MTGQSIVLAADIPFPPSVEDFYLPSILPWGAHDNYWITKIRANRLRDARNRRALKRLGWSVLRLWETDVTKNPKTSASQIKTLLETTLVRSSGQSGGTDGSKQPTHRSIRR